LVTKLDAELENVREFTAVPPPVTEFEGVRVSPPATQEALTEGLTNGVPRGVPLPTKPTGLGVAV